MATEVMEREEQLVAFHLAGEVYGVDIALIHEIIRLREITQIPRTAPEIEGVINLRGKIVPIMDLRRRLGLPTAERTNGTRIIVVENADCTNGTRIIVVENADCTVGLIVDGVTGVMRMPESRIEPPSKLVSDLEADFIRGVGKSEDCLVILLNMSNVLRVEDEIDLTPALA